MFHAPAVLDEFDREPVQQRRMRRRLRARPEVGDVRDQTAAKVARPDVVYGHARGEWILRLGQPARKGEAASGAGRWIFVRWTRLVLGRWLRLIFLFRGREQFRILGELLFGFFQIFTRFLRGLFFLFQFRGSVGIRDKFCLLNTRQGLVHLGGGLRFCEFSTVQLEARLLQRQFALR